MRRAFFLVALLVGVLSMASASVVDFNSYTPLDDYSAPVVSTGGLDFSLLSGGPFLSVWDGSSPNGNGTPALIFSNFTPGEIAITRTGGGSFDLNSFDMSISWYDGDSSTTVNVTEFPVVGLPQTLTLSQGLQTYSLNLSGVTQVNVTGMLSGSGYWVMDNVTYNATPEPASLALAGFGLIAVAVRFRRRKAA
jgi:hypothetical protein